MKLLANRGINLNWVKGYVSIIFSSIYFGPENCLLWAEYLIAIANADAADVILFTATKLLPTDNGFMYIPSLLSAFYTTAQNYPF